MAIPLTESVISFGEVAKSKLLPRRRRGARPNLATIYRWSDSGCRGVILESIQIGGTRCTSKEALQRFFDRLSADRSAPVPAPAPRVDRHAVRRAERVLDAAGI
jgi:hypothetical protein